MHKKTTNNNSTILLIKSKFGNFIILFACLAFVFTIALVYRISQSNESLIPLSIIPLLAGLIFEFRMISQKWETVRFTFLSAYLLSFFVFLPFKREHTYILDNHISYWPYAFCFFFILIAIGLFEKKLIPKLHEGITMLQSVTFLYWVVDLKLLTSDNIFLKTLAIVGLVFTGFSLMHAFSYIKLSWNSRFALSLWSSLIMMILSVENIWDVYHYCQIDLSDKWDIVMLNSLQYFLMGISSIYIVQNISMVLGFLPDKNRFFNDAYFNDINELKLKHTERYSTSQVKIKYSIIGFLISGLTYWINYYFDLFPRNLIIWMFFVLYPMFLWIAKEIKSTASPDTNSLNH